MSQSVFMTLDRAYEQNLQAYQKLKQHYDRRILPKLFQQFVRNLCLAQDFKTILEWWATKGEDTVRPELSSYSSKDSEFKRMLRLYKENRKNHLTLDDFETVASYCCKLFRDTRHLAQHYVRGEIQDMVETPLNRLEFWLKHLKRPELKDNSVKEYWHTIWTSGKTIFRARFKIWTDEDLDSDSYERWTGLTDDYKKDQTKQWIAALNKQLCAKRQNIFFYDTVSGYYADIDTSIAVYRFS